MSSVEAEAGGSGGPDHTTLPPRSTSLAGSPEDGPRMMLPFGAMRTETSPRVSAVVPFTKYQTGCPVSSNIVMMPGSVPTNEPCAEAGVTSTSVQPACQAVASEILTLAVG